MTQSALGDSSILIIDKEGLLGEAFCHRLSNETRIVLVSQKHVLADNVVFIPFKKKIPVIPGLTYSFIFVVSDPYLLKTELIFEICKKAKNDQAKFVVVSSVFEDNIDLFEKLKDIYTKSKIAIIGEMFGKNLPPQYSTANYILNLARATKKIKLENMGLRNAFPVFFEDAVEEILKAAFSHDSAKIFYVFPKNSLTQLSFSHMIHRIDPTIKIDFKESKEEEDVVKIPENGEYIFTNYSLPQKIKNVLEALPDKQTELLEKGNKSKQKKKWTPNLRPFFIFLLIAVVFPFLITSLFLFLGGLELKIAIKKAESMQFSKSIESQKLASIFFTISSASNQFVVFKVFPLSSNIQKGKKASEVLYLSAIAFQKIMENNLTESSFFLKNAISELSLLKEEGLSKDELEMITKFEGPLKFMGTFIDVSPGLLGFDTKKTYLILFQNNMELRPGGGFIGSYGLLSLEKGKVEEFSIQDVYAADGQLKGHVEPPFAIRRYIPLVHWYLRDSNFSLDFPKNAEKAAFFLQAETKKNVDGVVAVDVSFVKDLLSATGPLYIPDYNETVTADNLYILTQSHAEKNFFAGSTQKKDFLNSLFTVLEGNIQEKKVPYFKLFEAIQKGVKEKHILFSFNDFNTQKVFTLNKMSSSLLDERINAPDKINDFLGISEANLGVNKANYFIKRKVDHEVSLQGEDLLEKVSIYYKNLSIDWPGGDYKNYLRIIVPKGARLDSILIDGQKQQITKAVIDPLVYERKNFRPPNGLEVETVDEEGKTVFGFLLMVEKGALKKVEISYALAGKVKEGMPDFSYNLRFFKQPGTEEYPYSFSFAELSGFKIFKGDSFFQTNLNSDLDLVLKLAKK